MKTQFTNVPHVESPIWTNRMSRLASQEGWDIFEASGSCQNKNGDRPLQLQRMDEMARFEDDADAWRFVHKQAQLGSRLHQTALEYLKQESLPEYEAIIEECTK